MTNLFNVAKETHTIPTLTVPTDAPATEPSPDEESSGVAATMAPADHARSDTRPAAATSVPVPADATAPDADRDTAPDPRIRIYHGPHIDYRNQRLETWDALIGANSRGEAAPVFYRRDGVMVTVHDADDGLPLIQRVSQHLMEDYLADIISWRTLTRDGTEKPVPPPPRLARSMPNTPDSRLPVLARVISRPFLAADRYEIAMMDEHRIFIENEADTMDLEELAPIKSSIERQAEELKGKHQQFVKDTEKRWPRAVAQLRRIAWFYIVHSFAKSISTAIEEIHDKSSSAPTHPLGAKSPTRSLRRWWGSSTDSSSTWPGTGNSTSRPTPQPTASAPRVRPHRTVCPDMPIIKSGHIAAEAPSSRREWLPKALTAVPNTVSSPPALSRQPRCGLPHRRESTLGCCRGRAFGRAPLAPRSQMGRSNRSWSTAAAYAVMRRRSAAGAGRNVNSPSSSRSGGRFPRRYTLATSSGLSKTSWTAPSPPGTSL